MGVDGGEEEIFEAISNGVTLKIALEYTHDGFVHVQKCMCVRDAGGKSETTVTYDFLFTSSDEFEKWWDKEKTRFTFPDLMGRVKKWTISRLSTQPFDKH